MSRPEPLPDAPPGADGAPPARDEARGALAALRLPHFAPLWTSNMLHFFGLQVQLFTMQWLVTELTDSRTLIGAILTVQGTTVALLSPAAGVASDRLPRRTLLALCRGGLALALLGLAALVQLDWIGLGHLFAFAVGLGLLIALSQPPSQTYVFDVVDRRWTQSAVALNAAGIGLGMMAGPGLAGVLIDAAGVVGSWLIAAAGLGVAALLLTTIPIAGRTGGPPRAPLRELAEGFVYVWRRPPLRLALFVCAMALFNGALAAMRPVFARHVLEVGSGGMGLMAASAGLGHIVGALFATRLPDFRRPGLAITYGMLGFAVSIMLYSLAFSLIYVLVIELLAGLCAQLWQISTFAGLQMAVTERMRGRVIGIVFTLTQLAQIGGVFVGRLADTIGDQEAMAVFGTIPTVLLLLLLLFRRRQLEALGHETESESPDRHEPTAARRGGAG